MGGLSWLIERPIAHRGLHDANRTRWENTLPAFEAAARKGYAIECDVHPARDGVPVVFHDDDLKRLTGSAGRVFDLDAEELSELAVGGTQDRVPTLAAMLDLVAARVPVVIELKGAKGKDEGLVARVAALLSRYPGKAAVMSFDHRLIRRFPSEAPGIPGGLTAEGVGEFDMEAHFAMLACGISFVSYNVRHLPNPFVGFVRERLAMPVITWTVRDRAAADISYAHADQITFEGFEP